MRRTRPRPAASALAACLVRQRRRTSVTLTGAPFVGVSAGKVLRPSLACGLKRPNGTVCARSGGNVTTLEPLRAAGTSSCHTARLRVIQSDTASVALIAASRARFSMSRSSCGTCVAQAVSPGSVSMARPPSAPSLWPLFASAQPHRRSLLPSGSAGRVLDYLLCSLPLRARIFAKAVFAPMSDAIPFLLRRVLY